MAKQLLATRSVGKVWAVFWDEGDHSDLYLLTDSLESGLAAARHADPSASIVSIEPGLAVLRADGGKFVLCELDVWRAPGVWRCPEPGW